MGKGVSQIATAAMYVGVTVTAISVALTAGVPALQNLQDASSIRKAESFMQELDSNLQEVVSEGEGSTRTVEVSFDRGRMYYDNDSEALVYELETDAEVISPQSTRRSGNVLLSSNAAVTVENATVGGTDCYMMRNDHVEACIRDMGSPSSFQSINTSDLLVEYNFTEPTPDRSLDADMFVKLNGVPSTGWGEGYTTAERYGDFIGTGRVQATIRSEYGYTYDVIYSLPTGADFVKVDVQNFR
jgi:type II secretory pathway pseudopilin PulG